MYCRQLFYSSSDEAFEQGKEGHKGKVATAFAKFEGWLGQQKSLYTAGATPTAGDFHLWEMIDQHEMLYRDCVRRHTDTLNLTLNEHYFHFPH